MKKLMLSILAASAVAATAWAQDVPHLTVERRVAVDQAPHVLLDKISWVDQARMAVQGKVTPNAPYAADATTESVLVLADGNRIVRKTTTRVCRDSAGRTRQETIGPDGQVTTVVITDPVAQTSFVLDPHSQTASRGMAYFTFMRQEKGSAGAITLQHKTVEPSGAALAVQPGAVEANEPERKVQQKSVIVTAGEGGVFRIETRHAGAGTSTKEELGDQTIDGVLAAGTRTTTVIPAGAVDNELPIKIVSEEWFSPELQVLVMTRHSDPRMGDTTYRLSNITRTEPAKSMFELPAGFTVKSPEELNNLVFEKK